MILTADVRPSLGRPSQGIRGPSLSPQLSTASVRVQSAYLSPGLGPSPTHLGTPTAPHYLAGRGSERRTALSPEYPDLGRARSRSFQTRKAAGGKSFRLEKSPSPHQGGNTGAQKSLEQTGPASLNAVKTESFKTFIPFDPEMLLLGICPKKIKDLHKNMFLVVILIVKKK